MRTTCTLLSLKPPQSTGQSKDKETRRAGEGERTLRFTPSPSPLITLSDYSKCKMSSSIKVSLFVNLKPEKLKKSVYHHLLLLGSCLCFLSIQAQDIHYTQFHNAPFAISPGLTGVFSEDVRFMGNYRKQWASIKRVNYETYSVAADMKLWPYRANSSGFFAIGLSINRDQAGLSRLSLLNLGLNLSYTHRLSNHAFLSLGMQTAFNQRKFNIGHLTFDSQYDPMTGDVAGGNGETFFNSRNSFLSLGAGINFRLQALNEQNLVDDLRHRSKLDIGFGISNLNRPDQSFERALPVPLPMRFSPYILSIIQLGKGKSKFDLAINALIQTQKKYLEGVGMLGLKYHLSQEIDDKKAIQLSGAIRLSDNEPRNIDAIAPVLEVFINNWQFGISYDINVSDFKVATNGRGGPGFSVRYGLSKVKLPHPRLCRIL